MARTEFLRSVLLALAVYVLGLGLLVHLSRQTGPAQDELGTLAAIERSGDLIKRVASGGLSVLLLPEHRATLDSGLLVLAGAWSKLSLGRLGVLDPLTAMRLPWLLLGALAPLSVHLMLTPSRGRGAGVVGALACLVMPRFGHAVVVQRDGALVASLVCLVLAAHVRAMGPGRSGAPGARSTLGWALFGAVLLGFGAAQSLAVLWVLPLMLLHFAWARRSSLRRLLRRGRLPMPALVLVAVPVAPLVLLLLRPGLWKTTPATIARFFLAPLEPSIARTELAGRVVDRLPVPGGFAWTHLWHTLPLAIGLAALVGLGVLAHELLARRFASGSRRPPPERHAVGALAVLVIGFGLIGPALTPDVLTTFPPRVELVMPFVALLSAIGLERLARATGSPRTGSVLQAATLGALGVVVLLRAPTAGSSAGPLVPSSRRAVLPLGDGSELGALASRIDALGVPSVTLSAPADLSPELWRWLFEARRLRTRVTLAAGGELSLERGAASGGERIAEVRRDGVVLWSLSRARPVSARAER